MDFSFWQAVFFLFLSFTVDQWEDDHGNSGHLYPYLQSHGKGDLTIPPATVRVGRKEYKTNDVQITVTEGSEPAPGAGAGQAPQDDQGSAEEIDVSDQVFLRVIPSKKEVYVGEQFVSGLKVYTG